MDTTNKAISTHTGKPYDHDMIARNDTPPNTATEYTGAKW